MDSRQFVTSLVGSLAWPVTVVALAVLLRVPITRLLLSIKRFKYKDFEFEFDRGLEQVKEKAGAIDVKPQYLSALSSTKSTFSSAKRDKEQLLSEAEHLAQDFPEPAVAVGWRAVEDELKSAVTRSASSPDYSPSNSVLRNIELLQAIKIIDARTGDLLKRMHSLRNMAVHGRDGVRNITTDQAIEFISLARGFAEKLESLGPVD